MNTTANAAVVLKNKELIGSSECLVFAYNSQETGDSFKTSEIYNNHMQ